MTAPASFSAAPAPAPAAPAPADPAVPDRGAATPDAPGPAAAEAVALLAEHAALPGAAQVLDVAALTALQGREVAPRRVRIKPGASVIVGHRTTAAEDEAYAGGAPTAGGAVSLGAGTAADGAPRASSPLGDPFAAVGWTQLTTSADKRDGVLRRASRTGAPVREHPAPAAGTHLLSGGLDADPRLGRSIDRVLRKLVAGEAEDLRVLSYNPARHAVLALPGGEQVVRVAARPLGRLLHVSRRWRDLGVPTLELHPSRDAAALRSARWGEGDLATLALTGSAGSAEAAGLTETVLDAARAAGAAIARLHSAEAESSLPAARIGARLPSSLAVLRELLPHRAVEVDDLAGALDASVPWHSPRGLIHGDLSPDQVLVETRGGAPRIRIIDLDRSGLGPLGADLGSWLADAMADGDPLLGTALLEGYRDGGAELPAPDQLAAWTARALAASAVDPVRRFDPRGAAELGRRLDLARAVLADPLLLPLPVRSGAAAGPAASDAAGRTARDAAVRPTTPAGPDDATLEVPEQVRAGGLRLQVLRAWPEDGRGLPLELRDTDGDPSLRGARLHPASGEITLHAPGEDPRLPGLARVLAAHPGARIVSLRPGKRAVVRLDPAAGVGSATGTGSGSGADDGTSRFVKIVRPGRAPRLLAAIERARAFQGPFRTPEVLDADEDTVTFAALEGAPLHEPLPLPDGTWHRAWQDVLEAWAEAQRRAGEAPGTAPHHGPAAEREVLRTWLDRAAAVDPHGAAGRRCAVHAALRALESVPAPRRPALLHRDLHDKQLLHLAGARPALLDVDTAAWGDPGLDLGNLRAHARWRELQGRWSAGHADALRALIDAAAESARIPQARLAAYESSASARLTCVYAFRPRWRGAVRTLLAELVPSTAPDERTVTP